MRKKVAIGIIVGSLFVAGFGLARLLGPGNNAVPRKPAEEPGPQAQALSNERIGWGLGPNINEQTPDVPQAYKDLLKKYGAIWIGNTDKKQVALTFDMGYETEGCTPKVLEVLKKHHIKSVFFTTAHWITSKPDVAKRLVKEGHILANHTVSHRSMPLLADQELKEDIAGWEEEALATAGKQKVKYFRPPMGEFSERTLKITKDMGYTTVFWSLAIVDWMPMDSSKKVVKDVMRLIHPGAVILLHATSTDVVNSLDDLIGELNKKGYKVTSLEQVVK